MTVKEVAERLRVTPLTVRTWIKNGHLQAIALRKYYRIRQSDLDAFLGITEAHQ